jgi:hypothetical protein
MAVGTGCAKRQDQNRLSGQSEAERQRHHDHREGDELEGHRCQNRWPGPERIGELEAGSDHQEPEPQRGPRDQVDGLFERRIEPEGQGIDRNARRTAEDQRVSDDPPEQRRHAARAGSVPDEHRDIDEVERDDEYRHHQRDQRQSGRSRQLLGDRERNERIPA